MAATRSAAKKPFRAEGHASRLRTFIWQGTDKRGVKITGEQEARSASFLRAQLRLQGITPTSIKAKPKPLFGSPGKPIKSRDIALFSRQMATMTRSGVPIVTSLEIIGGGHKNPRMQKMLSTVASDIERGSSLSEAISQFPAQFSKLYCNLIRAGETAGALDTVMDTIASYEENIQALKAKIKKALIYPAMTVAVALIVSAILLTFVVPQFQIVFNSFGADLPAFTRMIIATSNAVTSFWHFGAVIGICTAITLALALKKSATFQYFLDELVLKVPVIGQILRNSAIARFTRTLAVTFKAGVPLAQALTTISQVTGNRVYESAVLRIRDDVLVGYPVNIGIKQTNLFPHMVAQMTAVGEEAGALDTMLFKVAEYYEQEVNNTVDTLSSLIEPVIMLVLGILVGGMVIGMYLPIFKLGSVVG